MSRSHFLKYFGFGSIHPGLMATFIVVSFLSLSLNAQNVPQSINYQAIVRDAETFSPISDQGVYLSVEFLSGPGGDVLYQEEFLSIQTGRSGLINVSLGEGNPMINSFEAISWESGSIWLRLSVDIGNGLNILQETSFNTVPYAFYANSSGTSSPDDDEDSANELIEEIVLDGTNLIISEGDQTQTVELNSLIDDEDADPLNEIQTLSLDGTALSISGIESAVELSELPGLGSDGDSDSSNELQELELVENSLTISNSPSNSQVDLSPYLDNTDNQALTLTETTLSLSGDVPTSVNLASVPGFGEDADADPNNERQDLELNSNELSITNNPTGSVIDLSVYLDNTDSQDITLSGSTLSLSGDATPVDLSTVPGVGDDNDIDPENELQDIQLSGDFLSLTSISPAAQVDLSPYDNSDLQENHIFLGSASNEAQAVPVTGDLNLANDGEITVTGLQSVNVSNVAPTDGQMLVYNSTESEWEPLDPPLESAPAVSYYSIDPLDFRELTDHNIGVDLDEHNAVKFFDDDAPFVMLRDAGIIEIMAPLHLPQGAVINNLKVYFRDSGPGIMWFRLFRKNMTNYSVSNDTLVATDTAGPPGDRTVDEDITNFNTVDNSTYSYRLYVRFTAPENNDNENNIDNIEQLVYGAVIEYTTN